MKNILVAFILLANVQVGCVLHVSKICTQDVVSHMIYSKSGGDISSGNRLDKRKTVKCGNLITYDAISE